MTRIVQWLDSKKTIIGIVAGGILSIVYQLSLISPKVAGIVATIVGIWTGISLRLAIAKSAMPTDLLLQLLGVGASGGAPPADAAPKPNGAEGGPLDS